MDKISVIVPVYNAARTLERCLTDLRQQTWTNLEILILDDGSEDESGDICRKHASSDPRIRYIPLEHGGIAAARNTGLSVYTGQYLMFADADDLVDPHYAEYLYTALKKGGTPVAYCPACDIFGAPPEEYRCEGLSQSCLLDAQTIPVSGIRFTSSDSHRVVWGAMFERSILEGLSFSKEYAVSTDTLFIVQVLHRCTEVTFLPARLYCYIRGHVSVSNRPYDRIRYDDVRVWEEAARILSDIGGDAAVSSRVLRDRKYQTFLLNMALQNSEDYELKRKLLHKVRFRYGSVFYDRRNMRTILGALAFVTWPEMYLYYRRLFNES